MLRPDRFLGGSFGVVVLCLWVLFAIALLNQLYNRSGPRLRAINRERCSVVAIGVAPSPASRPSVPASLLRCRLSSISARERPLLPHRSHSQGRRPMRNQELPVIK